MPGGGKNWTFNILSFGSFCFTNTDAFLQKKINKKMQTSFWLLPPELRCTHEVIKINELQQSSGEGSGVFKLHFVSNCCGLGNF